MKINQYFFSYILTGTSFLGSITGSTMCIYGIPEGLLINCASMVLACLALILALIPSRDHEESPLSVANWNAHDKAYLLKENENT